MSSFLSDLLYSIGFERDCSRLDHHKEIALEKEVNQGVSDPQWWSFWSTLWNRYILLIAAFNSLSYYYYITVITTAAMWSLEIYLYLTLTLVVMGRPVDYWLCKFHFGEGETWDKPLQLDKGDSKSYLKYWFHYQYSCTFLYKHSCSKKNVPSYFTIISYQCNYITF